MISCLGISNHQGCLFAGLRRPERGDWSRQVHWFAGRPGLSFSDFVNLNLIVLQGLAALRVQKHRGCSARIFDACDIAAPGPAPCNYVTCAIVTPPVPAREYST